MTDHLFRSMYFGPMSNKQLKELISTGIIEGIKPDSDGIDKSSFDLHITDKGYELKGCIKPFESSYEAHVLRGNYSTKLTIPPDGIELKRNIIYVFELAEKIYPPREDYILENLWGVATGKSTIGRVDVLVRLIADGMTEYDRYHAKDALGTLFLEIIPLTFNVIVKPGIALSQLRLFWGQPEMSLLKPEEVELRQFLKIRSQDKQRVTALTVNLEPSQSKSSGRKAIALKAKENDKPIPLWLGDENAKIEPDEYWEPIAPEPSSRNDENNSIMLAKNSFYILRSWELICLYPDVAVYCKAMDEALGEMRIHYAGFVHPYFGYERGDGSEGTNLIFEVRGHNMDIFLTHGETLAKLEFYRMSGHAVKEKDSDNTYGEQELKLSKLFKEW